MIKAFLGGAWISVGAAAPQPPTPHGNDKGKMRFGNSHAREGNDKFPGNRANIFPKCLEIGLLVARCSYACFIFFLCVRKSLQHNELQLVPRPPNETRVHVARRNGNGKRQFQRREVLALIGLAAPPIVRKARKVADKLATFPNADGPHRWKRRAKSPKNGPNRCHRRRMNRMRPGR